MSQDRRMDTGKGKMIAYRISACLAGVSDGISLAPLTLQEGNQEENYPDLTLLPPFCPFMVSLLVKAILKPDDKEAS